MKVCLCSWLELCKQRCLSAIAWAINGLLIAWTCTMHCAWQPAPERSKCIKCKSFSAGEIELVRTCVGKSQSLAIVCARKFFSSHPRRSIAWGRPVCQKVSKGLHGLFCRKVCRPFYHPDPVPCIKKSNKPIVTATFGVFATMNQDDLICWKVSAGMSKSSLFLGCVWQFSEAPYFQHVNLMQTLKPPFLDNVIDLRPVSNVSVPPAIKNNAHTSHRDVRPDTTLHCHWMHRKVNALNPTRA